MDFIESLLKGLSVPCDCCKSFQVYRYEREGVRKVSDDIVKEYLRRLDPNVSKYKDHRYVADCSTCGQLWYVTFRKSEMLVGLKRLEKHLGISYKFVSMEDSIRRGKFTGGERENLQEK